MDQSPSGADAALDSTVYQMPTSIVRGQHAGKQAVSPNPSVRCPRASEVPARLFVTESRRTIRPCPAGQVELLGAYPAGRMTCRPAGATGGQSHYGIADPRLRTPLTCTGPTEVPTRRRTSFEVFSLKCPLIWHSTRHDRTGGGLPGIRWTPVRSLNIDPSVDTGALEAGCGFSEEPYLWRPNFRSADLAWFCGSGSRRAGA